MTHTEAEKVLVKAAAEGRLRYGTWNSRRGCGCPMYQLLLATGDWSVLDHGSDEPGDPDECVVEKFGLASMQFIEGFDELARDRLMQDQERRVQGLTAFELSAPGQAIMLKVALDLLPLLGLPS